MKSLFRKLMFWRSSVPRVAMVRLAGVIASGGSPLRRGLNLDAVDPLLKKAFGLRRAKAVVLVINSPRRLACAIRSDRGPDSPAGQET